MASLFNTIKAFFDKMKSFMYDFFNQLVGSDRYEVVDKKNVENVENAENVENVEIENVEKKNVENAENKKRSANELLESDRIKRSKNATIKKRKEKKNKKPFKLVITSNRPFVLGTWAMTDDEPIDFTQPLNLKF